jgi:hypothetical protein
MRDQVFRIVKYQSRARLLRIQVVRTSEIKRAQFFEIFHDESLSIPDDESVTFGNHSVLDRPVGRLWNYVVPDHICFLSIRSTVYDSLRVGFADTGQIDQLCPHSFGVSVAAD